jgi:hypothetical protein
MGDIAASLKPGVGPKLATRARLLSFNRTQSMVVTGLLTGRNTLRRHVMGLSNNPTCGKCGAEEETSVHILWVWGLGFNQTCTSGFLLFGPWGYQENKYRGHLERWSRNRAPLTKYQIMGHRGPVLRPRCIGPRRAGTQIPFIQAKGPQI